MPSADLRLPAQERKRAPINAPTVSRHEVHNRVGINRAHGSRCTLEVGEFEERGDGLVGLLVLVVLDVPRYIGRVSSLFEVPSRKLEAEARTSSTKPFSLIRVTLRSLMITFTLIVAIFLSLALLAIPFTLSLNFFQAWDPLP